MIIYLIILLIILFVVFKSVFKFQTRRKAVVLLLKEIISKSDIDNTYKKAVYNLILLQLKDASSLIQEIVNIHSLQPIKPTTFEIQHLGMNMHFCKHPIPWINKPKNFKCNYFNHVIFRVFAGTHSPYYEGIYSDMDRAIDYITKYSSEKRDLYLNFTEDQIFINGTLIPDDGDATELLHQLFGRPSRLHIPKRNFQDCDIEYFLDKDGLVVLQDAITKRIVGFKFTFTTSKSLEFISKERFTGNISLLNVNINSQSDFTDLQNKYPNGIYDNSYKMYRVKMKDYYILFFGNDDNGKISILEVTTHHFSYPYNIM